MLVDVPVSLSGTGDAWCKIMCQLPSMNWWILLSAIVGVDPGAPRRSCRTCNACTASWMRCIPDSSICACAAALKVCRQPLSTAARLCARSDFGCTASINSGSAHTFIIAFRSARRKASWKACSDSAGVVHPVALMVPGPDGYAAWGISGRAAGNAGRFVRRFTFFPVALQLIFRALWPIESGRVTIVQGPVWPFSFGASNYRSDGLTNHGSG